MPILIGKNSNGVDQFFDLAQMPLLMISYFDEKQVDRIFLNIIKTIIQKNGIIYLITTTRKINILHTSKHQMFIFFKDEPESYLSNIRTRRDLLSFICKEITIRKKIMKQKKIGSISKYASSNIWNIDNLHYCFFLIDDIWDLVTANNKSIILDLIYIFLNGPSVGVHSVFASAISYRNLLEQLKSLNPKIKYALQKKYGIPEPNRFSSMGYELIFSPDGLIFFIDSNNQQQQIYYPYD